MPQLVAVYRLEAKEKEEEKKIAFTYSFHLKDPHVTPFGQRLQLRLIEIISISGQKWVRINHSWGLLSFEDDLSPVHLVLDSENLHKWWSDPAVRKIWHDPII